ncbi:unnamed protein product [Ixodes persulcatus]
MFFASFRRHAAWHVGEDHHCWKCRKGLQHHWMEGGLGLWRAKCAQRHAALSAKLQNHAEHPASGGSGDWYRARDRSHPRAHQLLEGPVHEATGERDRVCSSLSCIGMTPTVPQGGYFIMADFSNIASKADIEGEGPKDERFATWLCRTKKLLGIPPSSFYGPANKVLAQHLIRFCFMREDSTLHQAIQILNEMKTTM